MMRNNWQDLKMQYPTQINAVSITDERGNQGTFVHIRTALFTQLTRKETMTPELMKPELAKYKTDQENATIDSLTARMRQLDEAILNMEEALNTKYEEQIIIKAVLSEKLNAALKTLYPTQEVMTANVMTGELEELFHKSADDDPHEDKD